MLTDHVRQIIKEADDSSTSVHCSRIEASGCTATRICWCPPPQVAEPSTTGQEGPNVRHDDRTRAFELLALAHRDAVRIRGRLQPGGAPRAALTTNQPPRPRLVCIGAADGTQSETTTCPCICGCRPQM
jgi:hypothetical protein